MTLTQWIHLEEYFVLIKKEFTTTCTNYYTWVQLYSCVVVLYSVAWHQMNLISMYQVNELISLKWKFCCCKTSIFIHECLYIERVFYTHSVMASVHVFNLCISRIYQHHCNYVHMLALRMINYASYYGKPLPEFKDWLHPNLGTFQLWLLTSNENQFCLFCWEGVKLVILIKIVLCSLVTWIHSVIQHHYKSYS